MSINREQGTAARRPLSALSPSSVLRTGEDKGPSGRRIPPVVWAAPPLDKLALRTPQCQVTVPPNSLHRSRAHRLRRDGPSHRGTGDSGFWPDVSRERSQLGEARPTEVLPALVDSSGSASPESDSRSSAAAGCAHRNTAGTPGQRSSRRYRPRPGNCSHAPDYRLCHAPNRVYLIAYWVAQPPLHLLARSLRLVGSPLVNVAVAQSGGGES